jgi:hypothetical protein
MKSHEITTCKNKWTAAFVFYPCHAEQSKLWRPFSQRESNLPNHLFVSRRYKPYDWCNWQSNGVYLLRPHDFQDLSLLDYVHHCTSMIIYVLYVPVAFQHVSFNMFQRAKGPNRIQIVPISPALHCHALPIPPGWCEVDTLGPRRRATMRHWDPPDYHQGILRGGGADWEK